MKKPASRRIHAADGTVYRVAETPTDQRMREHYQREYANLIREARSLVWTRAAVHVAFAVPWVFCILWGFWAMQYGREPGLPTLWRWALAFGFGSVHGIAVDMGAKGHGFFGALHRWRESIAARQAALREESTREFAALDAPRSPDHFAA